MLIEKSESMIHKVLKSLCCSNGWSYGVFWRFDQRNSLLLTMEDAYYEEQMGVVIDNMLLQVHILGNGFVGQTAFTKKHQWIHSDMHCRGKNPLESTEFQDIIKDESENYSQFSSGMQTIAVISVEPQGVVQFGSTQKIPESIEFVNQTKKLFREMESGNGLILSENKPSSSNTDLYDPSRLFDSLMSSGNSLISNLKPVYGTGSKMNFGSSCSWSNGNQLKMDSIETPCTSRWSCGNSTLTSFQQQLPCEMTVLGSQSAVRANPYSPLSCRSEVQISQDSTFTSLHNTTGGLIDFKKAPQSSSLLFHGTEERLPERSTSPTTNFSQSWPLDNFFPQHFVPSSDGNLNSFGVEHDLFGGLGVDLGCGLTDGLFDDLLTPSMSFDRLDFSTDTLGCVLEKPFDPMVSPKKGLFSKLGIEQLLDCNLGNSNSFSRSSLEDEPSPMAKRRRTGSSEVPFGGNMNFSQPLYNLAKTNNLETKKDVIPKLEGDSWIGDRYSTNGWGNVISQPKKEEAIKVNKKKAKPGTRPRPKDRQLIQDRVAELRELVPNGVKMSIDSLLARTIKHMLFLQSVIKHADTLKQRDESKENKEVLRDHSSNGANGVTWACEFGTQTMLCPLLVEDLSAPGQMVIEMLCEERGFFLEIVDIIRGFGLTILKGVMEVRETNIWARFIVEAEARTQVTRVEIFMALVQLLEPSAVNGINKGSTQLGNINNGGTNLFNNFQQPLVTLPVSLAATLL